MLDYHNPATVAAPASRYSHGVEVPAHSRLLFVSGQVGVRSDGTTPVDAREQHEQVWKNIGAVLAAAGMGAADIVRVNGYITRADLVPIFREMRDRVLGKGPAPASTLVVVAALVRPEWCVEIEVVAARTCCRLGPLQGWINGRAISCSP